MPDRSLRAATRPAQLKIVALGVCREDALPQDFGQQEAVVASSQPSMDTRPLSPQCRLRRPAAGFKEGERRTFLVLADALFLFGAAFVAHAHLAWLEPSTLLVAAATTVVGVAALYSQDEYGLGPQGERAAMVGAAAGVLAALPFVILLNGAPAGLAASAVAWIAAAFGLVSFRRAVARWLTKPLVRKALLLGSADEVTGAWSELVRHPLSGLVPTASESEADCAVIGRSALGAPGLKDRLPPDAEIVDVSSLYERLSRRLPVDLLDERWFLERFPLARGLAFDLGKRALDVAAALFGLALSLPLLPPVALAIWLEDRGPIFYGQVRVGKDGRPFTIYKLRSMRIDAESGGAVWARKDDDRVTRSGRFLRKSRLDEVPQLFNVLRGDMSLVGPRPERPEFVADLEKQIPFYAYRHRVQPGLTGWAQVRYPYGASVEDAVQKLAYDLFYIKHRSIGFDLLIAVRTVAVVIGRVGSR